MKECGNFRHPFERVERRLHSCVWDITRACNLRCVHCENRCGPRSPRELDLPAMLAVADSLVRLGCDHVDVTGGEPVLKRGWEQVCRRLAGGGIKTDLVTNGTLIDDKMVDRAVSAGVGLVVVSIDGTQAIHDRTRLRVGPGPSPWRLAIDGLTAAMKRLPVVVLTQVNRQNLEDLPALRDALRALGVTRWQIQLAVPSGRLLDMKDPYVLAPRDLFPLAAFIEAAKRESGPPEIDVSDTIGYYTQREMLLRRRRGISGLFLGCVAGLRIAAIMYDGKVRGCSMMPAEFDAGDLHDETLEQIWNDTSRFGYTLDYDTSLLSGDCARCQFGPLCRAGCTTMAYHATGSIYENPYCLHRMEALCS
jgi:radical SAM protein with 4Fe4S-binding SPASM domain